MDNIKRPLPEGYEDVKYKTHFELRYLRWDYLVKAENPSDKELVVRDKYIKACAKRAYAKYKYEFHFMGMRLEDVENIARVHAVSYLGLYSSGKNKIIKDRHREKIKLMEGNKASASDLSAKDNLSMMSFINQRLGECAYVFRQKSEGEAGFNYYSVYVQYKGDEWPSDEELVFNPKKFGWKKLAWAKFVKIRDFFNYAAPGFAIEIEGKIYRVASPKSKLSDISFEPPPLDSKDPESHMMEKEEAQEEFLNGTKVDTYHLTLLFKERPLKKQERILRLLISWLKRRNLDGKFSEEIKKTARLLGSVRKRINTGGE